MTKVRFYLHDQTGLLPKLDLACLLLSKIYTNDSQAYVLMKDAEAAVELDDSLWVYEPAAFIPHSLVNAKGDACLRAPIRIGTEIPPYVALDRLVNLSDEMPSNYQHLEQVLEIVGGESAAITEAQKRYRRYKDDGCKMLDVHKESEIRSQYFRLQASLV